MKFINTAIDLDQLPAAENLSLQPVQATYKKVLRTEWLLLLFALLAATGVLLATVSFFRQPVGILLLAFAVLLFSGLRFLFIEKSFPFLAYALREKDLVWQSGWLLRSTKLCPFNRIQNCSVQSGPLERRYGLSSLIVYTAGSFSADIKIPGLLQADADTMRHFILEKIHAAPDADL